MALPYFRSAERWRACGLLAGVVGAEFGLIYVAVATNQWNAQFFNALEARDWDGMTHALIVCFIVASAAIAGMSQYYFGHFAYILWGLSAVTPLPLFGMDLAFPGYLIWIAFTLAGLGTLTAHWIGWRLLSR